jgi:hypothetical protein
MAFDNGNMSGDRNEWARRVIARTADNTPDQIMPDESAKVANALALARLNETPVDMVKRLRGMNSSTATTIKPQTSVFEAPAILDKSPRVIERPLENDTVDLSGISFNDTFAAARRAGLKAFTWKGNRYNTNLATEVGVGAVQNPVTTQSSEKSKIYPILPNNYRDRYAHVEPNKVYM